MLPYNRFSVAASAEGARVLAPPAADYELSQDEALELASWLVAQSGAPLALLAVQVACILGDAFDAEVLG